MNALERGCFSRTRIVAAHMLLALLGLCVDNALAQKLQKKSKQHRPNFVIVLCDDLGYGDLACYGHKVIRTPNVDRFAKEGLKLTSCYASAPNCSPSRTGMMTGRTPMRVGIHNWIPVLSPMHVRKREITIATLLRQAGYATCLAGKWHLNGRFNLPGQPQPSDHGFDHWFATQNNALPCHQNPENFVRNGKAVGKLQGFSADLVTDEAITWLTKLRDKEKPFFLFVNYHEPHDPIASARRFTKLYSNQGQRSRYQPEISSLAAHHGNVTQMDAAFGRLMKTLDAENLRENTLVFFTSDNGPAIIPSHPHGSAGPLRGKKGVVYEGGIRVPGLIRWPGKTKPGTVSDVPISGVDLLPTLCEITGIDPPQDRAIDGTSFLPLFTNHPIRRTTPLYWHFHQSREVQNRPKVAMRMGPWKILATLTGPRIEPYADIRKVDQRIIKSAKLDTFELYNLDKDIGERTNLAQREPTRLAKMSVKLREMFRDVQRESPTWPAWKSPRIEAKRIRDFVRSLNKSTDVEKTNVVPTLARSRDWVLLDKSAKIGPGQLILDGRQSISAAIYQPKKWSDCVLSAQFRVTPQSSGVLACGFMFRAQNDQVYYYVHFDRTQAILLRSMPKERWVEIKRISGLKKPAGKWHSASVAVKGKQISVTLNGQPLYQATDSNLKSGHIGFYAIQGLVRVKDIVVTGKSTAVKKPLPRLPKLMKYVVKNAGAGGYEAFPDVCRLRDGRLMCVYYAGYAHVSLPNAKYPRGGRVSCSFSHDEGRSWSPPRVLYDGPHDDRDPSITQLADGTLLCNFFTLSRLKRKGKSLAFDGTFVVRSNDSGKTWSKAQLINRSHPCSSPIRTLKNGTLALGLYSEVNGVAYGGVTLSRDQGKSWSRVIRMDNNGAYLDAETDVIQLRDGSLYAALRGGKGAAMHFSRSRDNGQTWTTCKSIGFPGHCPYLHRTADGIVLLGHRLPFTSLHYSRDDCRTWSENIRVDVVGGAYPSMANLKDGSVLIVYYEEGPQTNIRARRLKVDKTGLRWLTFK